MENKYKKFPSKKEDKILFDNFENTAKEIMTKCTGGIMINYLRRSLNSEETSEPFISIGYSQDVDEEKITKIINNIEIDIPITISKSVMWK